MKDFSLEILNAGNSENISILTEEAMEQTLGGATSCKKGYESRDDGTIECGCGYIDTPTRPPFTLH